MHNLWRRNIGKITIFSVLAFTVGFGIFLVALWSVDEAINYEPTLKVQTGAAPTLSAKAYIVLDAESGTEVVSKNSTEQLSIASITKLFAAAAFRELTDLIGTTTISWSDVNTEGRAGKLQAYEVYPYHELVFAMLLESSNDASATVLRVEPEILLRMNEYHQNLNFQQTNFVDTSGLKEGNVSSAYELGMLTRGMYKKQPHLLDISSMLELIGTHTGWINNSPYIDMEGYKGGKHGFTYEAEKTSVALFEDSISGHKRDFIYVVLGSEDLVRDIKELREHVRKHVTYE